MNENDIARLWSRIERRGPNDCWPIRGARSNGYVLIQRHGKNIGAHRLIYIIVHGPIPEGLDVDHLCHTTDCTVPVAQCPHRICCNPTHLALATNKDNALRGNGPTAINARKDSCPKCGGAYTVRTLRTGKQDRICIPCKNAYMRERGHPERLRLAGG